MTHQRSLPPGEQTSALMREIVRLTAQYTGRGPTRVRAVDGPDVICVVLQDSLTKGERLLLADGQQQLVGELRRAYFQAMRPRLLQAAGAITGRGVLAVLGDHSIDADVCTISFILAPQLAPLGPALALLDREPIRSAVGHALAH